MTSAQPPPGWNPALYGSHAGGHTPAAPMGRPMIPAGPSPPLSALMDVPTEYGVKSWLNMAGLAILVLVTLGFAGLIALLPAPAIGVFGLLVGTTPGFLVFHYVYWKDHWKDANPGLAFRGIVIGYIGIPFIILAEVGMQYLWFSIAGFPTEPTVYSTGYRVTTGLWTAFAVASLCEEGAKWVSFLYPRREKFEHLVVNPYSYIVYAMMPAMGLAVAENGLYCLRAGGGLNTLGTAVGRFMLTVPLHSATAVWMGSSIAKKRFAGADVGFFHMFGFPFLWHGLYDAVLFVGQALLDPRLDIEEQDVEILGYATMLSLSACCCVFPAGIVYAYRSLQNMFKQEWYWDSIRPKIGAAAAAEAESGGYQPPAVPQSAWGDDKGPEPADAAGVAEPSEAKTDE